MLPLPVQESSVAAADILTLLYPVGLVTILDLGTNSLELDNCTA